MSPSPRDELYLQPRKEVGAFRFDAATVAVFDDMISRSVPLYHEVQELSAAVARQTTDVPGSVWDLGCSTGTTLLAVLPHLPSDKRVVGLDASGDMLTACRERLASTKPAAKVELLEARLEDAEFDDLSLVFLNYTLQFLPPEDRGQILSKIARQLQPGGVVVVSEKVRHADALVQTALTEVHEGFKARNGYCELEIAQKRQSLENVLVPLTLEENEAMFRKAGFQQVSCVLKWTVFATWVLRADQ